MERREGDTRGDDVIQTKNLTELVSLRDGLVPRLKVENLSLRHRRSGVEILKRVDFFVEDGEVFALIGGSGAGKSLTGMAIMGLLDPVEWEIGGTIYFEGNLLFSPKTGFRRRTLQRLRGYRLSMIFQEHASYFHPFIKVSQQIMEALKVQSRTFRSPQIREACLRRLEEVGFPVEELDRYPHELSSGQRQRAMIAMTLLRGGLVISDEATSMLDPILKEQILALIQGYVASGELSLLLITHDLRIIEKLAHRAAVIEEGETSLSAPLDELLATASRHRIVTAMQESIETARSRIATGSLSSPLRREAEHTPALKIKWLSQSYERRGQQPQEAVSIDAPLTILRGEMFGIIGESGCGKTTLMKAILRVQDKTSPGSSIYLGAHDLVALQPKAGILDRPGMKPIRRHLQGIFQDADTSFNPELTIGEILAQIIASHHPSFPPEQVARRVKETLRLAGLSEPPGRFPQELSGGNKKKLAIACAAAVAPEVLIADEPFTGLDMIAREEVIRLFFSLRDQGMTIILISHDIEVVRRMCDRVGVMYMGQFIEIGNVQDLFLRPMHPYTRLLVSTLFEFQGTPHLSLSRLSHERGCRYVRNCPEDTERLGCSRRPPRMTSVSRPGDRSARQVRCFAVEETFSSPRSARR